MLKPLHTPRMAEFSKGKIDKKKLFISQLYVDGEKVKAFII